MTTIHWTQFAEFGTLMAPSAASISNLVQVRARVAMSTGCGCASVGGSSSLQPLAVAQAPLRPGSPSLVRR